MLKIGRAIWVRGNDSQLFIYRLHYHLGLSLVGGEQMDIYCILADLPIFILEGSDQ